MASLASLLGRTPYGPLQRHMEKVCTCAEAVPPLFDHLFSGDLEALNAQRAVICSLENEADLIKNQLRNELPRKLFMSVDRRDLLEILDLQDSIADIAEDIADLLVGRPWEIPPDLEEALRLFVRRAVDAALAARDVVRNVDKLVQGGLGRADTEVLFSHIDSVLRLEEESDELQVEATQVLFAHENSLSPVTVMLLYRMLDWIGDLADYPKKVCNRLRLLVAP